MEFPDSIKHLITYSILFPLAPLCFYPVWDYVKSRLSVLLTKIVLMFTGLTMFLLLVQCFDPTLLDTNYMSLICFSCCFYFYQREIRLPVSKKLFVFLTAGLVCSFSLLFATIADYSLYPTGNYMDFSGEALAVQLLFLLAADVVLYIPFTKYLGWIIDNYHEEAVWRGMCTIPLLFIMVLHIMVPYQYSRMYIGRIMEIYLVVLFFFVFLAVMIYLMFYVITYTYVRKQNAEYMNQFLAIQGAQYQQLLRTVGENSRIRHDFRHQLIVISELVNQKEYGRLEQYVHKYIENVETEVKLYSYSAAVNSVISYFQSMCDRKGIRTEFSVSLPNSLPISDQDLCILLGNLLENAIEASENITDPYICMKIRQTAANILAVKSVNLYRGTVRTENGRYFSSKRAGVGQGLESIRIIAQKYQGMMEVLTDQNLFTVKVLLQIPSGEQ